MRRPSNCPSTDAPISFTVSRSGGNPRDPDRSGRPPPPKPGAMLSSSHFQWSRGRVLLFLTALCALLFFYKLDARDFETTDEARRALVVRAMIESGDYVIPTLSGQVYLKKPPLYYWLAAIASRVADSTDEWVYRLPSAVGALGSVLLLFLLAERLLDRRAALIASVMLATCTIFVIRGSRAQIDMTLTFLVLVAMLCLERARAARWTGWAPWGFWSAIGFAFLAKGPAGLLFPIGAALALMAGPGFLEEVRRMRPGRGLLVILAIVLPWGIAVLKSVGVDSALGILAEEAFGGFNETGVRHREPFLFYLYETPAQFLPWCFFLPAAMLALREAKTAAEGAALRFAGAWILPALIVFSLSHQKRSFYLLPAFGALAIWHGWTVNRFVLSPATETEHLLTRRAARMGLTAICALAAMGALAGGAYLHAREPEIFAAVSIPLAAIGLWALYALVSFRRGRPGRALVTVVIGVLICVAVQRGPLAVWFNQHKSARPLARQIADAVPANADLFTLFQDRHSIEAYLGRPIRRIDSDKGLRRRLAQKKPVYVLLRENFFNERQSLFRRVVLRSADSRRKGDHIVLASNQRRR